MCNSRKTPNIYQVVTIKRNNILFKQLNALLNKYPFVSLSQNNVYFYTLLETLLLVFLST